MEKEICLFLLDENEGNKTIQKKKKVLDRMCIRAMCKPVFWEASSSYVWFMKMGEQNFYRGKILRM